MTHPNREGRERPLELLYEAEAKGVHPAEVVAGLPIPPVPYAAALAEGVGDHMELLDHLIGARARGWRSTRMPAVDRALLRLGTYELAFEPDQPDGRRDQRGRRAGQAVLHRRLAAFVNGVLGRDRRRRPRRRARGATSSCPLGPARRHGRRHPPLGHRRRRASATTPSGSSPAPSRPSPSSPTCCAGPTTAPSPTRRGTPRWPALLAADHGCDPAKVARGAGATTASESTTRSSALVRAVRAAAAPRRRACRTPPPGSRPISPTAASPTRSTSS